MPRRAATAQASASLAVSALATAQGSMATTAAASMKWILNGPALPILAADRRANEFLTATAPLVLQHDGDAAVPPAWNAVPMRSFTSYAHIKQAIERNALDPRVRAVMYDNEGWQFTPLEEQRDPRTFMQKSAQLVRARGLTFVSAPAVTLTNVLAPGTAKRYDAYLRLNLAADAARYADIFDIQAQGSQRSIGRYCDFVKRATQQARAANPDVTVLAGISTNPNGQRVTADDIINAIDATRGIVDGYWFNIPKQSAYCPGCNEFRPDMAIDVFDRLRGRSA